MRLTSSVTPIGAAAQRGVHRAEGWTQVEMQLEEFATATSEIIAVFAAEGPVGGFGFEVDEVEVR